MIQFSQLALRRGTRLLIEEASLQIHHGQKVGITGANGCGKSSLFALILGEIEVDAGELRVPDDWIISHVAQQSPDDDRASIEFVLDGDAELRRLEHEIEREGRNPCGETLANLHERFEAIGGYAARSRAGQLLHGLGFRAGDENRAVNEFSGGWRMRLALARALMCRSDLLLLDEPSNHLDLDAVIWLEGWLRAYEGTLLLISHDRDFLNSSVAYIVNIEQGRARMYTGDYSAFEKIRAEQLALQQEQYKKQQREIAHMRSFVERFRYKASKARQAQSRLKAIERMQVIAPAHVDSPFHFRMLKPEKLPQPLLKLDQVSVGYGETIVLKGVKQTIFPGDRIGLLGPNGAGKSTFIKLLAGQLLAQSGELIPARDLRVGYFAQHQIDQLYPDLSPLEHLARIDPKAREGEMRKWLGGFGFSDDTVFMPTEPFSGGEKSRLALALLVYQRPNLLLLDEPTNHLDLEMRQALAVALQEFTGAMVIVSHDRHLLRVSTDTLLLVHAGGITEFDGALDDYPKWLADRHRSARSTETGNGKRDNFDRKARKRREAEQRQLLAPFRKMVRDSEHELDALNAEKAGIESRLADGSLYQQGGGEELSTLLARQVDVKKQLVAAEVRWLEACDELERKLKSH
jgi:ATP-binding cassette subfamily F protein 3